MVGDMNGANGASQNAATQPLLGGECGKRLVFHIIDENVRVKPDAECFSVPRSNDPRDGWKPVNWAQIADAVNYVAHMLTEQIGRPEPGTFPTVAYIGFDDPRYLLFMIGASKAGFKALFISPRNSLEAQLILFDKTDCNILYHEARYASMVQPWIDGRPGMRGAAVAPLDEWIAGGAAPFPYSKTFAEAEWDPLVVLHTSGSTGFPKPVVSRHGMIAANDLHRRVPARDGSRLWLPTWSEFANPRLFVIMPLFHAAGIMMSLMCAFYYDVPLSFREPTRPVTGEYLMECLPYANPGWIVIPPAILDQLSRAQRGLDVLKKLHAVVFGGGPTPPEVPKRLVKHDVKVAHCLAATEFVFFPYYVQPNPSMWPWFIIPKDIMGVDWRPFGDNVYEQVIVRKDKHPGLQGCFYTFPELDEYSTKDLYRPHPTLPDHWEYVGRADDVIVFSTGEKLNPVSIEGAVMGHLGVSSAQVVGSRHFHAALLVEPIQHPSSEEEKNQFLDGLWPTIDKINAETVAHGRISRDYVFLSDPDRPFPRAGKGTVQRALVMKLYADDIERIFEDEKSVPATSVDLDFTSEATTEDSVRDLLQTTLKFPNLDADADFFIAGVDSLQAIQLSRVLRASLDKAGVQVSEEAVSPRIVYAYPTIAQLAAHVYSLTRANAEPNGSTDGPAALEDDAAVCDALVSKYTFDLPIAVPNKPAPAVDGQVIAITGTTGGLGSYLLDLALASPNVSKVVCLNRVAAGLARQTEASASRGLSTDFSRAEFLQADLAQPDLGLGAAAYARLAGELDRVIHNAWPVNFNLRTASFAPHVRGVRHLVDLSARAARKTVPVAFVSSVGTVERWPEPDVPIPEKALPDWSLAALGYGRSKLASSMILDKAAEVSGVPSAIIRVGQIAGPRGEKGKWNPQEWLPSLVCSSLYLGMLPDSLGTFGGLGWAPVEDIANVVLEVSGVTTPLPLEKFGGYFHASNPTPINWPQHVSTLRGFYGDRITKVVPMEEWVEALDKSQAHTQNVAKNPGLKLLDTYRAMLTSGKGPKLATERTEAYSPTMRRMETVSPDLMRCWCEQWGF